MDFSQLIIISLAIALVAFLYSSVGHAGASGYIATLTLFGFATGFIKPTALILNILVALPEFWKQIPHLPPYVTALPLGLHSGKLPASYLIWKHPNTAFFIHIAERAGIPKR